MNWQIDDRAIMVNCRLVENEGQECRIVGPMGLGWSLRWGGAYQGWDIQSATGCWCAHPSQLKPIPDDYKKKEEYENPRKKIIWAECPEWQPRELVVI